MIFNSFVLLSVLSLSAFAVPHSAHNHRGLASRVSARETPALPHVGKKRSMTKRCRTRPPPVAAAADPPANPKPEVENPKPQEPKPKPQEEATKPPKDDSKPKPEEDKPKPTPEEPETKPPKDDKPAQSEPGGMLTKFLCPPCFPLTEKLSFRSPLLSLWEQPGTRCVDQASI